MVHIPQQVRAFSGELAGLAVLDVGCGDMVADMGLLTLGVKHIHGLDVVPDWNPIDAAAQQVKKAGFAPAADYVSRLSYRAYDGVHFPFPDNHFDFVFSWSAFEHIPDVPAALDEIRRVVKPLGQVFLQVYPWFHTSPGSHLSDYIQEPFFHLRRSPEWVYERLKEYAANHPEASGFVLNHMWPEYGRLNGYSARKFLNAIMEAGFCIDKVETVINEESIQDAPADVPIADLLTIGTKVLLRPGKPFNQEQLANAQLQKQIVTVQSALEAERAKLKSIEQSKSWQMTEPIRAFMQAARDLFK